jgi:hypothetical protein
LCLAKCPGQSQGLETRKAGHLKDHLIDITCFGIRVSARPAMPSSTASSGDSEGHTAADYLAYGFADRGSNLVAGIQRKANGYC